MPIDRGILDWIFFGMLPLALTSVASNLLTSKSALAELGKKSKIQNPKSVDHCELPKEASRRLREAFITHT
jgi:hypothetical protein